MHLSDAELQRWLDSSLGPAGHKRVRAHLDSCESCRARRDEMAWLYQNLSVGEKTATAQLDLAPPADLMQSVMMAVANEPIPKRRDGRIIAVCVSFAIAALTIGLYATIGGGLEVWRAWAVEIGVQLGAFAQAAGGFYTAARVALGVVGPVIVLGAMTLVAGMAVTARLAAAMRRRAAVVTVREGNEE